MSVPHPAFVPNRNATPKKAAKSRKTRRKNSVASLGALLALAPFTVSPERDGQPVDGKLRGHRIRVDILSSNFPRFDVNPNTGEPLGDHRRLVTATNTLRHDRDHPSHIVLPVIPAR